jgi:high affinity Mn2+ porin
MSLTSTFFLGRRLWKGAAVYFNPEVAGGKGLSYAVGVAGALNGETFRIGSPEPKIYIARAFFRQHIRLGKSAYERATNESNQVNEEVPVHRITLNAGKFAVCDFFDDNSFAKDPRSDFFNWSVWENGAWDYPANTRGYTYGFVAEYVNRRFAFRAATSAVPIKANGPDVEYDFTGAHTEILEAAYSYKTPAGKGAVRVLLSSAFSRAPSYASGLQAVSNRDSTYLDYFTGAARNPAFGGKKYGLYLNAEQSIGNAGFFLRAGWNDGKYSTWAFTEIDRSISLGLNLNGQLWKRKMDHFGAAIAVNGISVPHQRFLSAGGNGFILGDGGLNYSEEYILESFYNCRIFSFFWLSVDYQFVMNPGYNKLRGPVRVAGLRAHIEF